MKYIILTFFLITRLAQAQNVDQLIQQHKDAMGLTQSVISTYQFDAEYRLFSEDEITFNCTVYFKAPDFWRIEIHPHANYEGWHIIVRGDSSWCVFEKTIEQGWQRGVYSNYLFMFTLPDQMCYADVLKLGKTYAGLNTDGNDQFWITVNNPHDGLSRLYTTSKTTNYITSIFEYLDKTPNHVIILSDYKTVKGVTYAAKMVRSYYPTMSFYSSCTKTNVQINIPVIDDLFSIPKPVAGMQAPAAVVPVAVVPTSVGASGNVAQLISENKLQEAINLINAGGNLKTSYLGAPPLYLAVQHYSVELLKLLIAKGADLNAKSEGDGYTALHSAVQMFNMEMVGLLVDAGADINSKNAYDQTPLKLAHVMGFKDIAKYLKDKGASK